MQNSELLNRFKIHEKLRFESDDGEIWLNNNRMLLLHSKALAEIRKSLFDSLDPIQAQSILVRMGFTSGQLDAELALRLLGTDDNYDVFEIGPALHGLEGMVKAQITESVIDWEKGSFYGKVDFTNSIEAEVHLETMGVSDSPVCWMLAGYASGYSSTFFKRFIVFRETQCVGKGDSKCVLVGKPVEAWGDDDYIDYFKQDPVKQQFRSIESELTSLRGAAAAKLPEQGELIGNSPEFIKAFTLLNQAADSPINVLLLGETGVGKELFARWLHQNSGRSDKPFIAINCGAIPNDLIEAELFGVKSGAYTGANASRPGRFESANGGTLFLDELGELSLSAQVKLLRVLQSGELERLGDNKTVKVDVRLIAATNMKLHEAIDQGRFRSDLYYRIATYPVEIPPLRSRKSDIPLLARSMVEKYAPLYSKSIEAISEPALQTLMNYDWPGNIRELQNIIERAVLLAPDHGAIERQHVVTGSSTTQRTDILATEYETPGIAENIYDHLLEENLPLKEFEGRLVKAAMEKTKGNMTKAAKLLGITRRQITYKLKSLEEKTSAE
ncbi:sigma 54-interacting transcriptional regulator [Amphritea pacifica]|uniref:Sigma 54-interacting transcriptional regulator n=1 Tax=Amphritea pacifica TaxID=2811233 RepID=A0ABS2W5I0_9GAMM|nr:sigma-54-dependent Fis family transcriptional regulator [Amphritea pacifica]MBN0986972.1 sigma 54-interacting transcriptional regulator [Amphritea pacifica]